ncbi:hypothetical protein HL658_12025 [Azospirillum sp. RWY-5-1]|uniref:HNH endonuclease n=1 Tax=Azospirillum oleiclasticum TaxID=2735135 RepID=A0ABX2T8N7_9PROT|nr:hypothetical protein [Azospirillum oleiclasticum]NYZ13281.1 hypothetical protein [Azospirillum oleiclasticum]NYZ20442.1 hypothetical protein [Azospirillum oleiclasticum]
MTSIEIDTAVTLVTLDAVLDVVEAALDAPDRAAVIAAVGDAIAALEALQSRLLAGAEYAGSA